MSRVLLIADDLDVTRRIEQGLGAERYADLVVERADLIETDPVFAAQELATTTADVIVLGPRIDPMSALAIAETLDRSRPDVGKVFICEPSDELWELAMLAGVRAIVQPDADPHRIVEAIVRALEAVQRHRAQPAVVAESVAPPAAVVTVRDTTPTAPLMPALEHRVITVLSPKGGSGKTTISTNLAAGLARIVPDGVALVDLDLQFGDVADALRLTPEHTLGDIRGRADQLDSAELKMLLARHGSGVYALCAPEDPAIAEEVRGEDVAAALSVLTRDLPYVVVDTAAGIDEAALTAAEMSTDLVLVASNEVPSIRNLRKLIGALDRIGVVAPRRHLVLNRAGSKVGIDEKDIEKTLGLEVVVAIPSSRTITLSVNHGDPLLHADAGSALAKPFAQLVGRFADVPAARSGGFSLFRRTR